MRRLLLTVLCVAVAAAALYQLVLRDKAVSARVSIPTPTAAIGIGEEAVAVGPDGTVLDWMPPPEEGTLPLLPLSEPPTRSRLTGTALQQARVLGSAPAALRPYVAGSSYGESGVGVMLRSGIELRFGDASQAERKWRAAAAVLADPELEAADYVDLSAPRRPVVSGSGHTLPPVP